ncbi:MAG TPA: gamma-glutamyl-gamma-aminobutyrate hydrolase family protein, partial [Puia sp.]|nr:gamma-glutamyl-gamma-aminobutyrate hydrolase family protein [Puia sp.]
PLIREYAASKPILGVCLGHQAIGEAFGGKLVNLSTVYHGVATPVKILKPGTLFEGLPETLEVGRYHSWVVSEENWPDELEVTARDEKNYVMGLRHRNLDVQGVQFHPESVLTPLGEKILANWLKQ